MSDKANAERGPKVRSLGLLDRLDEIRYRLHALSDKLRADGNIGAADHIKAEITPSLWAFRTQLRRSNTEVCERGPQT